MATPERDTVYTNDGNRTVYTRESNGTGWFVGIIVALALLAIAYLVFSANSGPSTAVDTATTPTTTAPAGETTTPAGEAITAPAANTPGGDASTFETPVVEPAAPATDAAPVAPAAPATAPAQ